jgi:hypothetical protein
MRDEIIGISDEVEVYFGALFIFIFLRAPIGLHK